MEYQDLLDRAKQVVGDDRQADAGVKAVFGILASKLDEPQARRLTDDLPKPLTYERLRGHQVSDVPLTAEQYPIAIATELGLDPEDSRELVHEVLDAARQGLPENTLADLRNDLPEDWARLI